MRKRVIEEHGITGETHAFMHSWCPTEASCPGKSCYAVHENEIHRQFKLKLGNNSHVPQVLWDWDWDLVEGVPRRRTVGIEGSDAVSCDYLVVRGVARRIFDHVELEGDIREKHAHTWARSRWRLLNSHLIASLFEQNKCFKIMILKHFFIIITTSGKLDPLPSRLHLDRSKMQRLTAMFGQRGSLREWKRARDDQN